MNDRDLERARALLKKLPPEDATVFLYHLQRHKGQIPPDPLPYMWFIRAGRAAGKTWAAANHLFEWTKNFPLKQLPRDHLIRVALVGAAAADAKHTMVEGRSGLRMVIPENQIVAWNRTSGELRYVLLHPVRREVLCQTYSSERPDQLRGPEHHLAWVDEVGKLHDGDEEPMKPGTTFSNLFMTMRAGHNPHILITGTPVTNKLVLYLDHNEQCVTTTMSTWENRDNLPESQIERLKQLKPGTLLYEQEVLGNIIYDIPDAIFFRDNIDENRSSAPLGLELVLGYDPATGTGEDNDESGIVLVGVKEDNKQTHAYVLRDESGKYMPLEGTKKVIDLVLKHKITTLCVELNQGMSFILTTLEQIIKEKTNGLYKWRQIAKKNPKYGQIKRYKVVTPDHIFFVHGIFSLQGKHLRAEPVAIPYELGLVHHTKTFEALEEQMVYFSPNSNKKSPDRLDALVFALLEIFGERMKSFSPPGQLIVPGNQDIGSFGSSKKNPYAYEPKSVNRLSVYNLDIDSRGETWT